MDFMLDSLLTNDNGNRFYVESPLVNLAPSAIRG